jgi:replicative DNA helicase
MDIIRDERLERVALKIMAEQPSARSMFRPEMFSNIQHAMIYDKIVKGEDGEALDQNLLISFLESTDYGNVGEGIVNKIFSYDYDAAYINDYVRKLSRLATLRKAQISLFSAADGINGIDIPELVGKLDVIRQEILKDTDATDEENSLEALVEAQLNEILEGSNRNFVKTGFKDFDTLIGGVELSDLVIIAARPSMGKTALMLRWMLNMAKRGVPVEIYSFEMSNPQIVRRLFSMESEIPTHRLQKGAINEDERERLLELATSFKSFPLSFRYAVGEDITEMANYIRLSHKLNGTKVFAIDYVQQMNITPGRETQDLNRIAKVLKNLAVELNIVIFLLSQLNRAVELRKNKRPMLSDIRQAGGLEESADKVLFIYRDYYYSKAVEDMGLGEIIVSKNRNGPIADFNVMFNEESTNFYV